MNCFGVLIALTLLITFSDAKQHATYEASKEIPIPSHVASGKIFPSTFQFGVSTSSYQVEGAWLADGKGMSIWDAMSQTPGMIANGDTGNIANEHYYKYKEDFQLMAKHGIKHYRFSIPWNRIMPTGTAPVNQKAVDHYNDFINSMLDAGIEPHVTMYHSETPLALTFYPNNPMPFLDVERFPGWFTDYAQVLFEQFGDRVQQWFTFNEPFCTATIGTVGNTDPYIIAHSAILAHAQVVRLYRAKYQTVQQGSVGIVLNTAHFYPKDPSNPDDLAAAQRGYDFAYGWFLDPLTKGSYPESMRQTVGDRLPVFTPEEQVLVTGALDFVALNYYFPYISSPGTYKANDEATFWKDMNVTTEFADNWPLSQTGWGIYGPGLRDLLIYTKDTYANIPSYITENGLAWEEDNVTVAVKDSQRQQYLHDHIQAVGEALHTGCNVKGYYVWSFQDNLEWSAGFQMHFGLVWIERPSLKRVVKDSLRYYSKVIQSSIPQLK